MNFKYIRLSRLGAALGASKQRSETYIQYDEQAEQLATTCSAKSSGRVGSSADRYAVAARRPE